MGLAAILMASQIKPGGMLDPTKIIGQLQPSSTGQKPQQQGQYQGQQQYGAPQGQHNAQYGSSGAGAGAAGKLQTVRVSLELELTIADSPRSELLQRSATTELWRCSTVQWYFLAELWYSSARVCPA